MRQVEMSSLGSAVVALLIGVATGWLTAGLWYHHGDPLSGDLGWALDGAWDLLRGENPYARFKHGAPLFYPLPALIVVAPLLVLNERVAAGVFFGAASAAMGYAVLRRHGPHGLLAYTTPLYWFCLVSVQWAPLAYAAVLVPWLLPLASAKPSLAVAAAVVNFRVRPLAVCAGFWAVTFAYAPGWHWDWLSNLRQGLHVAPVLVGPGPLLLLALTRWRVPEARLLAALSLLPQRLMFYDQLLVLLVARTWRERIILVAGSWVAWLSWLRHGPIWTTGWTGQPLDEPAGALLVWLYLPALCMVLREGITDLMTARASQSVHPPVEGIRSRMAKARNRRRRSRERGSHLGCTAA